MMKRDWQLIAQDDENRLTSDSVKLKPIDWQESTIWWRMTHNNDEWWQTIMMKDNRQ